MALKQNNRLLTLKKLLVFLFILVESTLFSQTSTVLTYTGSPQDWVVPPCVTSITVSAYGADGGGVNGGNGASVTATIPVTSGQTIQVIVGGSGGCPAAGYNGGGSGQNANTGANGSCGGGGKSQINIGGTPVLIAAGGGGMGGGNSDGAAGIGGCASGTAGSTTFGVGAGGGTQSAGGTGGPPWASGGYTGQNGSLGQGGNGASDPCYNNSPGGGGGGGYYGGGGGGSDCWDLSPYGGGGGGGGSSLVPSGGSCNAGVNNGQGYVTISYTPGSASISNTGPYCAGATIQLNSSSSVGSTYSWTGPNGFTSSVANPTIPNATVSNAGTYNLTITGGACNGTISTNVVVNAAPTPNAGVNQSICLGDPINLTGVVSNAANTSQWSYTAPGIMPAPTVTFSPNNTNSTPTVNVNQVGNYYFIFQEQNSLCPIAYDTVIVNVSELIVSTSFVDPTCAGSGDGTITITSPGAVQYSYNGGTTWASNSTAGSFGPGTYNVCARTATGCQECVNVTLTDPAPSAITVSNTGSYCEGETIQLNTTTLSGAIYTWTGPNGFTSSLSNPTIPNATIVNAGTYNLTITGTSCNGAGSTNVIVNSSPIPNAGVNQSICFGVPISLSGIISNPSNSYQWTYIAPGIMPSPIVNFTPSASVIAPDITVSELGVYYFILQEQNALCPIQYDTVAISVSELNITTSFQNPVCTGSDDGTINIVSPSAIEYSYDGGTTWVPNATIGSLAPGSYDVCARTVTGCQKCTTVVLIDPAPVTVTVSNDTLICQNGTGYLSANGAGGTSFLYNWNFTSNNNANQSVNPVNNTTYTVIAENEFGCLSAPSSIDVTIRPPLTGTISIADTVCPTNSSSLSATVVGGLGAPYTFTWSSGATQTGADNHSINVTPSGTTIYTVTVTDECESTPLVMTTTVVVAPLPVPTYVVLNPYQCEPAVFTIVNTTSPSMSETISWVVDGNQFFGNQDTIQTSAFMNGLYNIQMTSTSDQGCITTTMFTNALNVESPPVADFNASPSPATMFNTSVFFQEQSTGATSYQWYFTQGTPLTSNNPQENVQFPFGITGEYEVTLIVASSLGCTDTITKIIEVIPELVIYAPNTFTPDGDLYNQTWKVIMEGIDLQAFELFIYNRWGEVIWESHNIQIGWDGTYNGNPVPEGTYVWTVQAKDIRNDGKVKFNGHINLIR